MLRRVCMNYTQDLSSVLTDSRRTKTEATVFFTRHWGDGFVPKKEIPPSSHIPKVNADTFKHYLATTAKKHKHYLKSKRALRKALALHSRDVNLTSSDVPSLFLSSDFTLKDPSTFESVFLEPLEGSIDRTASDAELKKLFAGSVSSSRPSLSRAPSTSSVVSSQSSQIAPDSTDRSYRPYQVLHNKLEYYHDVVGGLLNNELSDKGEEFWKTVNSYGTLNEELADALDKVKEMRNYLNTVKTKVYDRTQHILALQRGRENRIKLLSRLEDIALLRDAQATVQMLLNQSDYPKALECIETAQEVLRSELKGVVCFRHLSSQLNELHKAIGKMLLDEFVTIIQREFGRPIEKEGDAAYQESQLQIITHGLIRCDEYKFMTILRSEIVEAVKMTIRTVVKNRLVECEAMIADYDPSLSLGEQMRQMSFNQWLDTLEAIFMSLYYLCMRVSSIQSMILDNADRVHSIRQLRKKNSALESKSSTAQEPKIANGHINRSEKGEKKVNIEEDNEEIDEENDKEGEEEAESNGVKEENGKGEGEKEEMKAKHDEVKEKVDETKETNKEIKKKQEEMKENGKEVKETGENHEQSKQNGDILTENGQMNMQNGLAKDQNGLKNGTQSNFAVAFLSQPCRSLEQLKEAAPFLIEHAILAAEERVSKRLGNKYKDKFLERCTSDQFCQFESLVRSFIKQSRSLVSTSSVLSLSNGSEGLTPQRSPLIGTIQLQTAKFIISFQESCKQKLSHVLDVEKWRPTEVPYHFQKIIDDFLENGVLRDSSSTSTTESSSTVTSPEPEEPKLYLELGNEQYCTVGACLLMIKIMAQYCTVLAHFNQSGPELVIHLVGLLKHFNSRTCQLILGAGAMQLVGLKTISVKTLGLTVRCLQLVSRFIPLVKTEFLNALPADKQNLGRRFDLTLRDYADHIDEIYNKLVLVVDQHLLSGLEQWTLSSNTPSNAFQHIIRQIGKFYNGFSSVMPPKDTTLLLRRIHENFKVHLAEKMIQKGISPHDALNYGMAVQEFNYYMENMRSLPDCLEFPDDSLASLPL
ncbi:unnamed protein product [Bursaphelenchus okinawaensis]|uniref:Vacuolar protein sorting-associated protein 54 n=1 Tax=Bursaphelenchus okinawaensis TaxID=465554 RepID=A0A811LB41_9BILA|nr:unnamed protein product [Bursaphelenchus okinawaensis]CAG9120860.1 unnamed protein product [Bursaphelenchus okinawaensis]